MNNKQFFFVFLFIFSALNAKTLKIEGSYKLKNSDLDGVSLVKGSGKNCKLFLTENINIDRVVRFESLSLYGRSTEKKINDDGEIEKFQINTVNSGQAVFEPTVIVYDCIISNSTGKATRHCKG